MNRFSWQQFSLLDHQTLVPYPYPPPPQHLALNLPQNTLQTHKNMGGNISKFVNNKERNTIDCKLRVWVSM